MTMEDPLPIEPIDPELDRLLQWWCHGGREEVAEAFPTVAQGAGFFDGVWSEITKDVGRNEPCPCGAVGRKFKKCCGR